MKSTKVQTLGKLDARGCLSTHIAHARVCTANSWAEPHCHVLLVPWPLANSLRLKRVRCTGTFSAWQRVHGFVL